MPFNIVVKVPASYKFIGFMVDSFELDKDDKLIDGIRVFKWKEKQYDQTDFHVVNMKLIENQLNVDFLSVDGIVIYENT